MSPDTHNSGLGVRNWPSNSVTEEVFWEAHCELETGPVTMREERSAEEQVAWWVGCGWG